jgi:flagellar export protein FliJ
MPRFIFHLQPVLNARLVAERERQRVVAALERRRIGLEEGLKRQQVKITAGREALRQGLVGLIDAVSLRSHAASSMRMMRDAQRLAVELAQVYESIERARADLAEAATARRAMELLRDRRFAQWKRTQEKREAALLDDLAGSKAARRRMTEEVLP